jgi:hypothetical protein
MVFLYISLKGLKDREDINGLLQTSKLEKSNSYYNYDMVFTATYLYKRGDVTTR